MNLFIGRVDEPLLSPPGGRQGKMPVTALEAFDLETRSWTRYACIPSRRAFSCCASNGRSLFSLGGLQQPGPHNFYSRPHFVNTMEEYDLDQVHAPLEHVNKAAPEPRP
ncbi:Kelch domain-containing protein 8B [Liparis tanakae]|uniref:Kelch domain-containing protein 8B n=1 Tax=Liparis tanakae TaxID=230148 RepID=A0A4Z2EV18_9TELE|nr:Kelch domain-containing protein 8B [Liparis tanakae]